MILIEDCLIFNYESTAQVEKHLVIGTVWEVHFTDEEFHIVLTLFRLGFFGQSVTGGGGYSDPPSVSLEPIMLGS